MALDRILVVTHSYAPAENPRALRWSSIAQHWAEQGIPVDVLTSFQSGLAESEFLRGVTVYRVGKNTVERLRSRFGGSLTAPNPGHQQSPNRPLRLSQSLRWLHDHTWKKVYWPDYACLWIQPASRAIAELLSSRRYSTIISVSDPYSSHIATYRALRTSTHRRWLVDMGDPFSSRTLASPNNRFLYKSLNFRTESEILAHCSALSVTTVGTANQYASLFPNLESKTQVIGPLLSAPKVELREARVGYSTAAKKLVYVGTLYPELRSPDYLLRLLEHLIRMPEFNNLEMHFYGGCAGSDSLFGNYTTLIGKNVVAHGIVPREQALMAMQEADVLVNIGNQTPVQLPSKLVEYIWAGRPILNIASHESDSAAAYLDGHPALLNLFVMENNSFAGQVGQLASFLRSAGNPPATKDLQPFRDRSKIETIASQYLSACGLEEPKSVPADEPVRLSVALR